MPTRVMRLLLTGLVLVCSLAAACNRTPALNGAVAPIPVYAPSSLEDFASATTSDDLSNLDKFSSYHWYLSTKDPPAKVLAFYDSRLSGSSRQAEDHDDGDPVTSDVIVWAPPGAKEGEAVRVIVDRAPKDGRTRFSILEDVLKGRRR